MGAGSRGSERSHDPPELGKKVGPGWNPGTVLLLPHHGPGTAGTAPVQLPQRSPQTPPSQGPGETLAPPEKQAQTLHVCVYKRPLPPHSCSNGVSRQFSVESAGLASADPAAAPPTPPPTTTPRCCCPPLPLPHPSPSSPPWAPAPVQNHRSRYSGIYIYFQLMLGSSH